MMAAVRHRSTLILLMVAGVLTVGGLSVAGDQWSDTTTLPEWIEALSTAAAFLAAMVAAWYAVGAFRLETRRERRWVRAQRSAQASLVAGWIGVRPDDKFWSPRLVIRNASDLPVNKVRACVWIDREPVAIIDIGPAPPGAEPTFHWLLPELEIKLRQVAEASGSFARISVALSFTDSANRAWNRNRAGNLRPGLPLWSDLPTGMRPDPAEALETDGT